MRSGSLITIIVLSLTPAALAQTAADKLTTLQKGIACAPPVVANDPGADALLVLGSQTAEPHNLNGNGDMLVLNRGTAKGVAVGQQYFVREVRQALPGTRSRSVTTNGWVTVVTANEATAIAAVANACGPILSGNFLEPFSAPQPPPNAEDVDTSGELDFSAPARVLYGVEGHERVSAGSFLIIDRGAEQGVAAGQRFAFYRDPQSPGLPLVAIGEAVVVSVGPSLALVRVNQARTEVQQSDYVVPRK